MIGNTFNDTETAGSTDLVKDSFGGAYARDSFGVVDDITYQGRQMSDGYFPGWSMVGAETINGTNTVAWMNTSGQLSIWATDANWSYSSYSLSAVNSSEGLEWETAFNQDFNNDQIVGVDPLA